MQKYSLDIFITNNIPYDWRTVYVGFKINIILINEISLYATQYLLEHPDYIDPFIAELAYEVNEQEIEAILIKIIKKLYGRIIQQDDESWNFEIKKWRYCILQSTFNSIEDVHVLVEQIDNIFSDFGYPEDLKQFISYYPQSGFRTFSNNVVSINIPKNYRESLNNYLLKERSNILGKNCSSI